MSKLFYSNYFIADISLLGNYVLNDVNYIELFLFPVLQVYVMYYLVLLTLLEIFKTKVIKYIHIPTVLPFFFYR